MLNRCRSRMIIVLGNVKLFRKEKDKHTLQKVREREHHKSADFFLRSLLLTRYNKHWPSEKTMSQYAQASKNISAVKHKHSFRWNDHHEPSVQISAIFFRIRSSDIMPLPTHYPTISTKQPARPHSAAANKSPSTSTKEH